MKTWKWNAAALQAPKDECWLWDGAHDSYGYSLVGSGQRLHRIMYQLFRGAVPLNRILHHTCENPGCINPHHLEAMTQVEHSVLHKLTELGVTSRRLKTHCKHGHLLSGDNLYLYRGRRHCKACRFTMHKRRQAAHRASQRQEVLTDYAEECKADAQSGREED